jgi:hypothetical protein
MVGYFMKNIDEDHVLSMHHNDNGEMMEVDMFEFVKYGTIVMENHVCFTHHYVLGRVM